MLGGNLGSLLYGDVPVMYQTLYEGSNQFCKGRQLNCLSFNCLSLQTFVTSLCFNAEESKKKKKKLIKGHVFLLFEIFKHKQFVYTIKSMQIYQVYKFIVETQYIKHVI